LSDASVICRVVYFQFPNQATDVAENVSKSLSDAQHTAQGKDFEVIIMAKMENRHPIEEPLGSEFLSICNHCGVMTV